MLHVLVGGNCNNNCIFCMEDDREERSARAHALSPKDIEAMITGYPDRDGVLFTSGEPSLDRQLPRYIRLARQSGYRDVGLITNARLLAYAQMTQQLVAAGLTQVTVSIHAHQAKLHDALTRTPGSFEQTLRGLDNLCALEHRPRIFTSTVVNRHNLEHLAEIFHFLAARPIEVMVFNVMMTRGRGALHLERLMPRYRDVVAAVVAFAAELDETELNRVRVEDLPACIAAELPERIRGHVERYEQFEPLGATGLAASDLPASSADTPLRAVEELVATNPQLAALDGAGREEVLSDLATRMNKAELRGEQSYYRTDRASKEKLMRVKGEPCVRCTQRDSCAGVWSPYIDRFGWEEMKPL